MTAIMHYSAIRPARPADLPGLSELCLRSKAMWGYDASFMAACRDELTLRASDLITSEIVLIEDNVLQPRAVLQICMQPSWMDVVKLFVDPASSGCGLGRQLFEWAVKRGRICNINELRIDSDPQAAGFYRCMGATQVGQVASGSIEGRWLPMFVRAL